MKINLKTFPFLGKASEKIINKMEMKPNVQFFLIVTILKRTAFLAQHF